MHAKPLVPFTVAVLLMIAGACGDLAGPDEQAIEIPPPQLDIHCHDDGQGGNDDDIYATGIDCHYVPGGGDGGAPPRDGNEGGGGGGGDRPEYGFLLSIEPGGDDYMTIQSQQLPCPPSPNADEAARARGYAWCNGKPASIAEQRILNAAIKRIADRGSVCKQIADAAHDLIISKRFRIYKIEDIPSGVSVLGGIGGKPGVALVSNWLGMLNDKYGEPPWEQNLESAIAHEVQHYIWGWKHPATQPGPDDPPNKHHRLPYDTGCSGLAPAPL